MTADELILLGDGFAEAVVSRRAAQVYALAVEKAPDNAFALYKHAAWDWDGDPARQARDYTRAAAILRERLKAQPKDALLRSQILSLTRSGGNTDLLYDVLLADDPEDPAVLFFRGAERTNNAEPGAEATALADHKQAMRVLEKWRKSGRGAEARRFALAEVNRLLGFESSSYWPAALLVCDELLRWVPDDVEVLAQRAAILDKSLMLDRPEEEIERSARQRDQDRARATAILEARITKNPRSVEARLLRISVTGDPTQQLADVTAITEITPNDPAAWLRRARLLDLLIRRDEALRDYSRTIELDPDNIAARMGRGTILAERNESDAAIADFTHLIELGPDTGLPYQKRAYRWQALAKERKDFELNRRAIADLTIAAAMSDPGRFDAATQLDTLLGDLIRELRDSGDTEKAIAFCTELLEANPGSSVLYRQRAELHHQAWLASGKRDRVHQARAFADLQRAIEMQAFDPALIHLKWTWYAIEERSMPQDRDVLEMALADATRLLALQPSEQVRWLEQRGRILARLGYEAEAFADLDRAVELAPDRASSRYMRALTHREFGRPEQALADLGEALARNPANAVDMRWTRASILRDLHRHREAIADYQAILQRWPEDQKTRKELDQVRRAIGDWDSLIASTTARMKGGPDDWQLYVERAQAQDSKGDRAAALADYGRAIELAPERNRNNALSSRATALEAWGDIDAAFADWERILSASGGWMDLRLKRARVLQKRGDFERARADYDTLIGKDKATAALLCERAQCHLKLGDRDRAMADVNRAIELEPRNASARVARGRIHHLVLNDPERALADFRQARMIDYDDIDAQRAIGALYAQRGIKDWASVEIDAWIAAGPPCAQALRERGLRRRDAGDLEGAVADLTAALEITPDDLYLLRFRIGVQMRRRNYVAALDDANRLIELAPKDAESWKDRARVLWDSGKRDAAMADYRRAIEVDPQDSSAWSELESSRIALQAGEVVSLNSRAAALFGTRDWAGGIALLDQALRIDPDNEVLLCNRANAVLASGDAERALRLFEAILELHPGNREARLRLSQARSIVAAAGRPDVVVVGNVCFQCGGRGTVSVTRHEMVQAVTGYGNRPYNYSWESKSTEERCSSCGGKGSVGP